MFKNNKGFSLLEILIALALAALMYGLFNYTTRDSRTVLNAAADDIEKAIKFAQDESSLRNTIVRLNFFLDKDPQEYAVESGPDESFILPSTVGPEGEFQTDMEKEQKKIEETSKNFRIVSEFDEKNRTLSERISLVGFSSSLQEKLITKLQGALYFYPSGEKDSAIIILGTEEEVLGLIVDSFSSEIERIYRPLEKKNEELATLQAEAAKELFDEWVKEK